MNHEQALAAQLPERYAYGDLPGQQRDEFEEHLADCSSCLQDVTAAQALAANMRAVFQEQTVGAESKAAERGVMAWLRWRPILAFSGGLNLALAATAAYAFIALVPSLNSEIGKLQTPAISTSFMVAGAARGTVPVCSVPENSIAHFRFDLPKRFDHYEYVMEKQAGGPRKTYNLRRVDDADTLDLTVPVAGLEAGDYKVQVSGLADGQAELLASFVLRVAPGR